MQLDDFIIRVFKQSTKLDNELLNSAHYIARRLVSSAQTNATIDPKVITGELWKSIGTIVKKTNTGALITLKAGNSTAYYAPFQELGTNRLYPRLYLEKARNHVLSSLPEELKKITKIYLGKMNG